MSRFVKTNQERQLSGGILNLRTQPDEAGEGSVIPRTW